jgi:hypothetical protein
MGRKKRRPYPQEEKDNLEWYMDNFKEECEVCHSELLVHAFRRGSVKWHKAVYATCHKKNCRNHYVVICFYV